MTQRNAITSLVATRKPAPKTNSPAPKAEPLTGKARRHLRALGHSLDPVLQIGKTGISDALLDEFESALMAHELVKVRLLRECPVERDEAAEQLAHKAGAEHVQTVGNVLLLYRQRPKKPTLEVPGVSKPPAKVVSSSKAKAQIHHRAKSTSGQRGRSRRSAESGSRSKRTAPRKSRSSSDSD